MTLSSLRIRLRRYRGFDVREVIERRRMPRWSISQRSRRRADLVSICVDWGVPVCFCGDR